MAEKIIGNIVGVPNPKSDWNQTDSTKADYIKNAPKETIEKMKRIAHYGDADITPSDSRWFKYTLNADEQSYTIKSGDVKLGSRIVIPYEYNGLPITRISGFRAPSLQEVILPNCIQSIMSSAFYSCGSLAKVVIPDSVIYIGDYAFEECVSLIRITIPNSVTTIGEGAFYNCSNLKRVYVSNGIETIGSDAFSGCGDLNVYLADGQLWGFPTRYKDANITLHYDWNPLMRGEASETYATKEEIGDRSQLIDSPNDDLVTAINNAYDIANSASRDANQAQNTADDAMRVAKGRATGYVFDTVDAMNTWLSNPTNAENLVLGDNLYIRAKDVPDYWWDGTSAQELETQKVDFTEYATKEELDNVGIALDGVINGGVEVKKANYSTSAGKASQATYANEASNAYQATADGNGNDITITYATKSEVGDIETALDGIIAIQNTLIGGGSE